MESDYSVNGAWWAGHTPNIAIPAGKSAVATLKYNGSGTNNYVPVLIFTNGKETISDETLTSAEGYSEYAVFQGSALYGWCGNTNTNSPAEGTADWSSVTVEWGANGVPDNSVLTGSNIPYSIVINNSADASTFSFTIKLTGTDSKEYTGTVSNIPGGADLTFHFACDQNVTLTFD